MAATASPQLYENGFSPLLARYANGPEAPASTAHATHVAAYTPIQTYIAPSPYVAAYPAVSVFCFVFFFWCLFIQRHISFVWGI